MTGKYAGKRYCAFATANVIPESMIKKLENQKIINNPGSASYTTCNRNLANTPTACSCILLMCQIIS